MKNTRRIQISLEDWNILDSGWATDLYAKLVRRLERRIPVLFKELIKHDVWASLPATWHPTDGFEGSAPADALTVDIISGDYNRILRVSLKKELMKIIHECRHDGSHAKGLRRIANEMEKLVHAIDKACSPWESKT